MPEPDLLKTGIKGLDDVLFGGVPRGNIILVAGTAGTGKTTLGVEFVYRGARQFNEVHHCPVHERPAPRAIAEL